MENCIHVSWAIHKLNDKTLEILHTSIVSLLLNTYRKVFVHVLCDDLLTGSDRRDLKEIVCNKYNQNIKFYDVEIGCDLLKNAPMSHSRGTYYRLYIGKYLDKKIEKIIYFDYDVIIHMDIGEIYDLDLDNKEILAQYDSLSKIKRYKKSILKYFEERDIDVQYYFNAGILLINMQFWNTNKLEEKAIEFFQKFHYCRFVDQDFLNAYFKGKWGVLPQEVNKIPNEDTFPSKGCWHFAGGLKPWKCYIGGVDNLYWRYYFRTIFCDDIEELLDKIPIGRTIEEDLFHGKPIGNSKMIFMNLFQKIIKISRRFLSNKPFGERY